jgi:ubiquitin-activating enzyme E1
LSKVHKDEKFQLNLVEFEKDDDKNGHIDFMTSVANLRARNYKITEAPRHSIKLIAGKIIPAIATTTAMVVGACGIELYKYAVGKDFSKFRNSFMNLAIPLWVFSEPLPPIVMKDVELDPIMFCPVKAIPPSNNFPFKICSTFKTIFLNLILIDWTSW